MSVIPTLARVFERLIYNQIYDYLTVNNLLNPKQYGFRSLHSTALALSESTNHWLLDMGNGEMNSVIFLDIKKAFDKVNHDILLQKRKHMAYQVLSWNSLILTSGTGYNTVILMAALQILAKLVLVFLSALSLDPYCF